MDYTVRIIIYKPQDYEYTILNSGLEDLEHTSLTQHSLRKRLQVFGEDESDVVFQGKIN